MSIVPIAMSTFWSQSGRGAMMTDDRKKQLSDILKASSLMHVRTDLLAIMKRHEYQREAQLSLAEVDEMLEFWINQIWETGVKYDVWSQE
jgi:hypothetical protein